ncbi:MAG: hypothetical protein LBB48_06710 [Treponema sp.]|nr:hypothetical protein [Treponema sp.]
MKYFTGNVGKTHIYRYEKGQWTEHDINKTGGDYMLYGPDNCSLEICFSRLENYVASAINKHSTLNNTENYNNFMKSVNKLPREEVVTYVKECKKDQDRKLVLLEDDNSPSG